MNRNPRIWPQTKEKTLARLDMLWETHYGVVQWPSWRLELPVNRMIVKQLVQTNTKETSKFAVLSLCGGIHWLVVFPHKGTETRKMLPFDDVIRICITLKCSRSCVLFADEPRLMGTWVVIPLEFKRSMNLFVIMSLFPPDFHTIFIVLVIRLPMNPLCR